MTRADLTTIVAGKLDEDLSSATRYVDNPVIHRSLYLAETVFATLTLCIEKTVSLTYPVNEPAYDFAAIVTDFIAALRVSQFGKQIHRSSVHRFAAEGNSWMGEPGMPYQYAMIAANIISLRQMPSSPALSQISLAYAAAPGEMANDAATPQIPEEDHDALASGAAAIARQLILGGQMSEGAADDFEFFLKVIDRRAAFVRDRAKSARYDTLPAGASKQTIAAMLKELNR